MSLFLNDSAQARVQQRASIQLRRVFKRRLPELSVAADRSFPIHWTFVRKLSLCYTTTMRFHGSCFAQLLLPTLSRPWGALGAVGRPRGPRATGAGARAGATVPLFRVARAT